MTDPRERLDKGALTRVKTKLWADTISLFTRSTSTPLDQPGIGRVEGLFQPQDQATKTAGELIIFYVAEFGVNTAQAFVTVDINGTREWKPVMKRTRVVNSSTSQTW